MFLFVVLREMVVDLCQQLDSSAVGGEVVVGFGDGLDVDGFSLEQLPDGLGCAIH